MCFHAASGETRLTANTLKTLGYRTGIPVGVYVVDDPRDIRHLLSRRILNMLNVAVLENKHDVDMFAEVCVL